MQCFTCFKLFLILIVSFPLLIFSSPKLAIKFYVSEDYTIFKKVFFEYMELHSKKSESSFIIVFDKSLHSREKITSDFSFIKGFDFTLASYNSYLEGLGDLSVITEDYDILLLCSSDAYPILNSYDNIVLQDMLENFRNLDGVIEYASDTPIFVFGKNYLKSRSNLFSNELKKSLFYHNLRLDCAHHEKYLFKSDTPFKILNQNASENLKRAELLGSLHDKDKLSNLNLFISKICKRPFITSSHFLFKVDRPLWSILIPSTSKDPKGFENLYKDLVAQILSYNLIDYIEVLYSHKEDLKGLVEKSSGKFLSVITPQDSISFDYTKVVFDLLVKNPDVIELTSLKNGSKNFHFHGLLSNKKKHHFDVTFHPISLKNPVRKDLVSHTLQIKNKEIRRREAINKPIYFSSIRSREDALSPKHLEVLFHSNSL